MHVGGSRRSGTRGLSFPRRYTPSAHGTKVWKRHALHDLVEQVRSWLAPSVRLIVAAAGITFPDSSGLRGLLEIQKAAADNGSEFAQAEISDPVRRVPESSDTSEAFIVVEDLSQV